LTQNY